MKLTPKQDALAKENKLLPFLLDKLNEIEDKVSTIETEIRKTPPEDVRIEKVASRMAAKMSVTAKDGEDGHTPTDEELLALIEPLIPDVKSEMEQAVKKANDSTFAQLKQRAMDSVQAMFSKMNIKGKMDEMYQEHEAMMEKIEEKMPDTEKMMTEMMEKMPAHKDETPEETRDKLESLKDDERLDKSAIKGLEDMVKKLEDRISSIPRGGSRVSRNNIYKTLTPDGSTKIFSVPKNTGGIVIGSDFPTVLMEGAGFTINASRTQITLTVDNAPSLNSQLVFIGNGVFNV